MVIENEIPSFLDWLVPTGDQWHQGALFQFLVIGIVVGLGSFVLGYLVLLVRYGPSKAGDHIYKAFAGGVGELTRISPRRVAALAWLAVKESWRRQAIVALVIYGLILGFASWFLKVSHQDPAKVLLDFVLAWTTFLMLLQGLLLSAFSLPAEFTSRTLYTIVTKPVRSIDIVLGRILGFTLVGTVLLAIMGGCSYLFVNASLNHTHTVDAGSLEDELDDDGQVVERTGETSFVNDHRHIAKLNAEGFGAAESTYGHYHDVDEAADGLKVGPPLDFMRARVPKRGELDFLNREGIETDRGVSVGAEWTYRSFVPGGTNAAAIWTFDGITPDILAVAEDGTRYLPLELTVRVFRTHKGNIEKAIRGSIQLQNPDKPEITSSLQTFPAKDMSINAIPFPEELYDDTDNKPISLMDDLVSNGRLQVVVRCVDGGQYFGFARADCHIRLPEGNPEWNFIKAHLGIWVQMAVVISIGVMASTVLNGPIAALLTVAVIILGYYRDLFLEIAKGEAYGGGPIEAFVRIWTGMNLLSPFENEDGIAIQLMKGLDNAIEGAMLALSSVLPDFPSLSSATYVAQGYDIPNAVLGRQLMIALAYIVGLSIAGFLLLRTREVAK
ncbi:MAG: hypothetical protein KDA37_00920 [Planctomycetales bacterium]|nr:hypothetical protein [Planctomycetales bacterium]